MFVLNNAEFPLNLRPNFGLAPSLRPNLYPNPLLNDNCNPNPVSKIIQITKNAVETPIVVSFRIWNLPHS